VFGIHETPESYSDRWIEYCSTNKLPYRIIDCFASDIITQCADIQAILWHWTLNSSIEKKIARSIITSLETMGIVVYPSVVTCWHYDDKVAQKYLLEAIGAPVIPTFIFYNIAAAKHWAKNVEYPLVFKLRAGAGSSNVKLIRSYDEAMYVCNQAFGRGFSPIPNYFGDMKSVIRRTKGLKVYYEKLKRIPRGIIENRTMRSLQEKERSYAYFQQFLPSNPYDTRVTIIGERAFAFHRMNRIGDFRASGSGRIVYEPQRIDLRCVEIAFGVAKKLRTQSLAFDFLMDGNNEPRIGEISYCFVAKPVYNCSGYWDPRMQWHDGHVWPQDAIIEDVLLALEQKRLQTESR
jgi:glutathione synthase/RimK-type ligase-like ATP-grasp enzyme